MVFCILRVDKVYFIDYSGLILITQTGGKNMANIAKCARATEVMNKVKGGNPFVFNSRFIGYNEKVEGIVAQQREADRRLKEIQAQRLIRAKGVA